MPVADTELADVRAAFNKPFAEQLAFFRKKLNLPTERWDDVLGAAHDRAFIVASVTKADLLFDLRGAIDKSIAEGKSLSWFRGEFDALVRKHGWTGWTGEGTAAGRAWRTRTIYTTNLRTSHAAGRYAQMTDPDVLAARPYWMYVHRSREHPRLQHKAWNGTVLPAQDPWFDSHFAPNGWGCKCLIQSVSERGLARMGKTKPDPRPNDGSYDYVVPGTGEVVTLPRGVQYGWDYAPGANAMTPLRDLVQRKLITYPPAIGAALSRDLNKYLQAEGRIESFAAAALSPDMAIDHSYWLGFAEQSLVDSIDGLDLTHYVVTLPADAVRHVQRSHGNDGGTQRAPTPADYATLRQLFNDADKVQAGKEVRGRKTVVIEKTINGERFRAVFEVNPGKKQLALKTLMIKSQPSGD